MNGTLKKEIGGRPFTKAMPSVESTIWLSSCEIEVRDGHVIIA